VIAIGDAWYSGDLADKKLSSPIAGLVPDSDGAGYWLMAEDGGIFAFDAPFLGSAGTVQHEPMVSFSASPSRKGYWMTTADGVLFPFGDASSYGDLSKIQYPSRSILHMAPTASGGGYYMLSADGGVFSFGDAQFFGSTGGQLLPAPVVTIEATPTGRGYWLIGGDGAIYPFGDAPALSVRP
jgi:hypothetical protein